MSLLERLVGQQIVSCSPEDIGGLSLQLSNAVLAFYNPVSGCNPNEAIGSRVESVRVVKRESLSLALSNGQLLRVSLKDEDYSGPEAFQVQFSDGTIVVE